MQSSAAPVEAYLAELPEDRRTAIAAVRDAVNASLPPGYEERMQYGMISWVVPLAASASAGWRTWRWRWSPSRSRPAPRNA